MNNLIATFAGLSPILQDAVHGANGAMISALVEHRGVDRGGRRILKTLLMKASQHCCAFRLSQSSRRRRPGRRDYDGRKVKTFPAIERSTRDVERHAGLFHAHDGYECFESRHYSVSVGGNGRP